MSITFVLPRLNPTMRVMQTARRELAKVWRPLTRDLFDPYRPELHYMRGPGPKWHAKHDADPGGGGISAVH